jgi:hypothetical protein
LNNEGQRTGTEVEIDGDYAALVIQVVDAECGDALELVAIPGVRLYHWYGGKAMTNKSMAPAKWALALALVLPMAGCMAAAAAAGAGAGIYLTTRGAESMIEGSIDQIAARARAIMSEEGIVPDASTSEQGGDKREFKGKKGDLDVTIEMERKSPTTTRVEVSARKNLAEWDKEYAQRLLQRIIEKG